MQQNINIKLLDVPPIPTGKDLGLIFSLIPDYTSSKVFLLLMASAGLRPTELPALQWNGMDYDINKRPIAFRHFVSKQKNRRTMHSMNLLLKQTKKKIISQNLSNQLFGLKERQGEQYDHKIFNFRTEHAPLQFIKRLRAQYKNKYSILNEKTHLCIQGNNPERYKFSAYSLRRFAITFHYWVIFDEDIALTSRYFGHVLTATTQNYIYPYQDIGLTKEMIKNHISFDNFLALRSPGQLPLDLFSQQSNILNNGNIQKKIRGYSHE